MSDLWLLDPNDGVHIDRVNLKGVELSLHASVWSNGTADAFLDRRGVNATAELFSWADPTLQEVGACNRLQLVLEGVARYLNTGGDWDDLYLALHRMRVHVADIITIPDYSFLVTLRTYEGDDSYLEHYFLKDGTLTDGVVWVEGSYVEERTIEEIVSWLRPNHDPADEHPFPQGGAEAPGQLEEGVD